MDRDERLMAVLGSRLLQDQKKVGETAEAIRLRQSGEDSALSVITTSVSESLTQVLRWVYWWNSTEVLPYGLSKAEVTVKLNTDFGIAGLSSQDLQAIVAAWQSGAISRDTMFELFRSGEILPDGRTNEDEEALIGTGANREGEREPLMDTKCDMKMQSSLPEIQPCESPQVFYGSRREPRCGFGSEAFRTMEQTWKSQIRGSTRIG
jgi:Domain of unknown function (DUF4055)